MGAISGICERKVSEGDIKEFRDITHGLIMGFESSQGKVSEIVHGLVDC